MKKKEKIWYQNDLLCVSIYEYTALLSMSRHRAFKEFSTLETHSKYKVSKSGGIGLSTNRDRDLPVVSSSIYSMSSIQWDATLLRGLDDNIPYCWVLRVRESQYEVACF